MSSATNLFSYQSPERVAETPCSPDNRVEKQRSLEKSFHLLSESTGSVVNSYAFTTSDSPESLATTPMVPQLASRGNRVHQIGRKFAFWRKKPKAASDVYASLQAVCKTHDRYRKDLKSTLSVMREWTEYLAPPSLLTQDLLHYHMVDVKLSQWMGSLVDTISPVVDTERKSNEVYAALVHSFQAIKKEETNVRILLGKHTAAERKYYKSLAGECNSLESQQLLQECTRYASQLEIAKKQFGTTCRRELPVRFKQLANYYSNVEREVGRAAQSLEHLLNAEYSVFSRDIDTQSFCLPTPSSVCHSPSSHSPCPSPTALEISPLQTPRYPGLKTALAPETQQNHEAITPSSEGTEGKNAKPEATNNLELPGVRSEDFIWR